jgi:hypothetical protein
MLVSKVVTPSPVAVLSPMLTVLVPVVLAIVTLKLPSA